MRGAVRRTRIARIAILLAVPTIFAGVGAARASAAEPDAMPPGAGVLAPRHCVSGPSEEVVCYATFTEAIAAATGGQIADAPADPKESLEDPRFGERLNALARQKTADLHSGKIADHVTPYGGVVIGISYIDAGYAGNSWVWIQPHGCDGLWSTVDFTVPNLNTSPYSNYGFNDSISSFRSFANCGTVLYDDWWFGGAATNGGYPIEDMSYVGDAMNDRASSIRWF
jgi:hypothetical protein